MSSFNAWVTSALMHYVRELELYLGQQNHIELPEDIYTSRSLEVLKLDSDFVITVPPSGICFPSVKILCVWLQYSDNNMTEELFCSCPSLEDLSINAYLNDDGPPTNFIISLSTLKRFAFRLAIEDNYFSQIEHTVMVTAPNLACLHIISDVLGTYMVHEQHSLKEGILDICYAQRQQIDPNHAIRLLKGVKKTKLLSVSTGIVSALDHAKENVFPLYPELRYLGVKVGWRVLPIILSSSSKIETVILKKQCWFEFTEKEFGWIEREIVAHCLVKHVKKIEIKGVEGDEDELRLVKYLLKCCRVLETMIIRCKGSISNT